MMIRYCDVTQLAIAVTLIRRLDSKMWCFCTQDSVSHLSETSFLIECHSKYYQIQLSFCVIVAIMRGLETRSPTCPHFVSGIITNGSKSATERRMRSRITPVRELHSIQPRSRVSVLIIRFSSLRSISCGHSLYRHLPASASTSKRGEKKLCDGPSLIINHRARRDCWEMENIETFDRDHHQD